MNVHASRVFAFSNELSRCLELVEKTKENPALLREVLANAKKYKMQAERCHRDLLRFCAKKVSAISSVDVPKYTMLLSLYSIFPDLAVDSIVVEISNSKIQDRTVVCLFLKASLAFIENEKCICFDNFIERHIETHFGKDAEIDYLFLDLLCQLSRRKKLAETHVQMLEDKLSLFSLSLTPKLILLAASSSLRYKAPKDTLKKENISLYTRVMDALTYAGAESSKEKVLSMLPCAEEEFVPLFQSFLLKEAVSEDYTSDNTPIKELFLASPLHMIKKAVRSEKKAEDVVEHIRAILEVYVKPC